LIYLLLVTLLVLLLVSYYFCGKDFFAPATMLLVMFSISTVLSIYNINYWKFSLGLSTYNLIVCCMLISLIVNSIAHSYKKKRKKCVETIHPIKEKYLIFIVLYMILCLFIRIYLVRSIIGSGSILNQMAQFRMATSYSSEEVSFPTWATQLINLGSAIIYVVIFNLAYYWNELTKNVKTLSIVSILLWVINFLLTAARFEVFSMFISGVFIVYMVRIKQTGRYRKLKLKELVKIVFVFLIAMLIFYFISNIVGRASDKHIIEYIAGYLGSEIPNLDLFIKRPPKEPVVWGQETFFQLIQSLRRHNVIDVPYLTIHKEIRVSNGHSLGNTYTALRDYYYDFGFGGALIMHTIFSLIFSFIYENIKRNPKGSYIIIFSTVYSCVVFYVFNNSFFGNDLTVGFAIKVIEVYILYSILCGKKRFRIKRRRYV